MSKKHDVTHECKYCGKILSSKINLKTHQEKAKYCLALRGEQPKNAIQCEFCDHVFLHKYLYENHMKTSCVAKSKHNKLLLDVRDGQITELSQLLDENKKLLEEREEEIQNYSEQLQECKTTNTERLKEIVQLKKEISKLSQNNKKLTEENNKLRLAEQLFDEKHESTKRKLNLVIEKQAKDILRLEKKLAFEQGRVTGYEQKAMITTNTTNVINTNNTTNNVMNKKLAKICIANIDPFTVDMIQKNIDKFTMDRYISGAPGVVEFIEDITKFVDEDGNVNRNYVCTDKSRNSFYHLLSSMEWKADDGISCINSVLDTLSLPAMQLEQEINRNVRSDDREISEKYKGILMKGVGKGFTKQPSDDRSRLVSDVRNGVKDKLAI